MSKLIKLTDENKREYLTEFFNILNSVKLSSGEILYKKIIPTIDRKATLYFTPKAWGKMLTLINRYNTEVGWHGLAKRGDDETKDEYIVYDILLYPQTVTGSNVNTDQGKYTQWLYSQTDDDFAAMKFHGHSHVRMATTPSGTDKDHQTGILDQLTDEMFYIFTIWNKSLDLNAKIYDMKKNILFETPDINIKLCDDDCDFDMFFEESKEFVQEYKYQYNSHQKNGYTGSYTPPTGAKEEKKDDTKPQFGGVKTQSDNKGKIEEKNKNSQTSKKKGTVVPVSSYSNYQTFDDYDDPYGYNY